MKGNEQKPLEGPDVRHCPLFVPVPSPSPMRTFNVLH